MLLDRFYFDRALQYSSSRGRVMSKRVDSYLFRKGFCEPTRTILLVPYRFCSAFSPRKYSNIALLQVSRP